MGSDRITRDRDIGIRIRRKRLDRGWSQARLAQLVGVSQGTLSRWEGGSRSIDIVHAERLARHLETPALEIVTGAATPRSDEQALIQELRWWGLDVRAAQPDVMWTVRPVEETIVEALASPDPRVVDRLAALFFLHPRMRPGVLWGFAESRGVQRRLGWLVDVAREVVAHGRGSGTDVLNGSRPEGWSAEERERWDWDSLGRPAADRATLGPVWKRWKIDYDRRLVDLIAAILPILGDHRES